jgi:energy-coupling factor transporter ATP-binding protein EcfA2
MAMRKSIQFEKDHQNDQETNRFWESFIEAARIETNAEAEERRNLGREPLSHLIERGEAIGPLVATTQGKQTILKGPNTGSMLNTSALKPTDKLCAVNAQGRVLEKNLQASLEPNTITLNKTINTTEEIFLRTTPAAMTYKTLRRLVELQDQQAPWPPDSNTKPLPDPEAQWKPDDPQAQALNAACGPSKLVYIKGPPGTGKTKTLGWAAAILAKRGHKIIVTSHSHKAVETALIACREACNQHMPGARICKKPREGTPLPQECIQNQITPEQTNKTCHIFGCTSASLMASKTISTDRLLIDEAGQMAAFTAAALSGQTTHMAFFGDEDQLEPILTGEHRNQNESAQSIAQFIQKYLPKKVVTLQQNYRSNPATVAFTKTGYYPQIPLVAAPTAGGQLEENITLTIQNKPFPLPTQGVCAIELSHQGRRNHCPEEAQATIDIIAQLLGRTIQWNNATTSTLTTKDFAVLCPNRRQANTVAQKALNLPEGGSLLTCGTVHRLQGLGRAVVILSSTASHPSYIAETAEFLYNKKLWNVGTSRGQVLCIILHNSQAIREARPKTLAGLECKDHTLKIIALATNPKPEPRHQWKP